MFNNEKWQPFSWHCPNCGNSVIGYKDNNQRIKVSCDKCKLVMVRTIKGRRHDTIEIYAPRGEEHLNIELSQR